MLRITLADSASATTFKLEGKLSGAWVGELERCWRSSSSSLGGRALRVDLKGVSFVDEEGRKLLSEMHRKGAQLIAAGPMLRQVVEEIARNSAKLAALAGLLALVAGTVRAQGPPPPLRLTLREAVQLVLKQNPQVQIANLNLAQSQQDAITARADVLPQASFNTFERVQRFNLEAFIGMSFPGLPQHAGPFETFQAGPQFSVPVFDLTAWKRWRASQHGVRVWEAQERGVREQMAALVVSQYLGALRASANVAASRSRVTLAEALYKQAADLQQAGVGTGIDTLRANVQLQNERQRLIGAETQLKTFLFGLARLLNIDRERPIELADERSFFETPTIELDHSVQAALANRPELRALAARELALQLQRQATSASRLPKVAVQGFWAYQGVSPVSVIPAYLYQISVDVPLYTGGRIGAEVARADIELNKLDQQRRDVGNQVAMEVKTAAAEMESARTQVDVANLGVKLAEEEVTQARDRFQAGVANNVEVITAQDALARAADNQIFALYRYNQARADLAYATGQMETIFAK